ncbi:MAG: DUF1353 domain-containing protein [Magnetospiraceae bacterium]
METDSRGEADTSPYDRTSEDIYILRGARRADEIDWPDGPLDRHPLALEWRSDSGRVYDIVVPIGFVCDLASTPAWSLTQNSGRYNVAAVVHDWLYFNAAPNVSWRFAPFLRGMTRKEADECFRDIMVDIGVGFYLRNKMYLAVRVGGWRAWRT